MKDRLKDHINNNRPDFEVYQGDEEEMWKNIAARLAQPRKGKTLQFIAWKVAAIIILSAGISWFIFDLAQNRKANREISLTSSPEFSEAEEYYSTLIDKKINFLKVKYPSEINKEFLENLNDLDTEYKTLKDDLKDNLSNTEVIDAMIRTYRKKLQILEEISKQLEEHHATENPKKKAI